MKLIFVGCSPIQTAAVVVGGQALDWRSEWHSLDDDVQTVFFCIRAVGWAMRKREGEEDAGWA